jgi:hypothetical protein
MWKNYDPKENPHAGHRKRWTMLKVPAALIGGKHARWVLVGPVTDEDRKNASFIARCISDLDDPVEHAAALADFVTVMKVTKGRLGSGPIKFGRITFTAPKVAA